MTYSFAVIGATNQQGRDILNALSERQFPIDHIYALDSQDHVGQSISFGDDDLTVEAMNYFDFSHTDIVFLTSNEKEYSNLIPQIIKTSTKIIDVCGAFSHQDNVPMMIPQINGQKLFHGQEQPEIISSPSSLSVSMAKTINALMTLSPIKRLIVSSYQAVSDKGRQAMDELFNQTRKIYVNDPIEKEFFTKQMAFNVIPHIGDFRQNGSTHEEWSLEQEMKKIFSCDMNVSATCVQVPVFIGHGLSVYLEAEDEILPQKAREIIKNFPELSVIDYHADEGYVTPVECVGEDCIYISRIRQDHHLKNALSLWIVADSLRVSRAINGVDIAQFILKKYAH